VGRLHTDLKRFPRWDVKICEVAGTDPQVAGSGEMSIESRVEYFLRAAARAEREGNLRLAAILRKMAEELSPVDLGLMATEPPGSVS